MRAIVGWGVWAASASVGVRRVLTVARTSASAWEMLVEMPSSCFSTAVGLLCKIARAAVVWMAMLLRWCAVVS